MGSSSMASREDRVDITTAGGSSMIAESGLAGAESKTSNTTMNMRKFNRPGRQRLSNLIREKKNNNVRKSQEMHKKQLNKMHFYEEDG